MEAGVKYVKQDCLYGETFPSPKAVREQIQCWLEGVANRRLHGTTGERPREQFDTPEPCP